MNKKILFTLLLIILLGTVLRFYDLSQESLWTDEMVSLIHVETDETSDLIESVTNKELTPAGYFILMFYWIKIFGNSEFSLRFISAISDILSIFLIYLIGSKIFNKKVGLFSALILSTTMLQIVYAQEFRPYSLLGTLVLLSTYIFLNLKIRETNKKFYLLLSFYSLINAAILYVGYMGIFLIVLHFLSIIWIKIKNKNQFIKNILVSLFATFLLFIPGIKTLIIQTSLRHPSLQKNLILRGVPQILSDLGVFFYLLPLTLLIIITISLIIIFKKFNFKTINKKDVTRMILIFLPIMGLVHLIFLETTLRSFALIRHPFFIIPFFYLLIAYSINKLKSKKLQIIILTAILIFNSFTLTIYYHETTKAPWETAVQYIEFNSNEDNLILFDRSGSNIGLYEYYKNKELDYIELTWDENGSLKMINETDLMRLLKENDQFWLISSRNIKTKEHYIDLLNKNFHIIDSKNYTEMMLYKYSTIS